MKKLVIGILAHVDAGKTTLSEAMLYTSGSIRKMGRVDNQDAFLDTYELERERGITIFSKQARFSWKDTEIILLDTPGHVDFSAEMERTLQVLDYAILVVNGADGIQGHTQTLWKLLKRYQIPTFIFVNKMDQPAADQKIRMEELKQKLNANCINMQQDESNLFDELAMCDEEAMEYFLENGMLQRDQIQKYIAERKVFPCYFGSALKLNGITELMDGMAIYTYPKEYPKEFGAKVYKIARDNQGNRLTYIKVTGGTLKVKDVICEKEKVNQIRIYSGEKFVTPSEASAGEICAVTGLTSTRAGEGLGAEKTSMLPVLEPVLTYRVLLPEGVEPAVILPKLRQLEEEEPELHLVWKEELKEIQAQIMGDIQLEILQRFILDRFGIEVSFGTGNIVYKETIKKKVEGVGHFEPLRHYAEVHLLLEPTELGSGMQYEIDCSEDILDKNWQRLIYTHFLEREQKGVLTGSVLTDTKITLVSGKAHQKHTEGGDFRQATYRAIRQGLMQTESVLLEPYYEFQIEVPVEAVGRVMTDVEKRSGTCQIKEQTAEIAVLTGRGPVATMQDYAKEVMAYTKGRGQMYCALQGYDVCHNQEEVIKAFGYDPERDLENTPDSVFCANGAGFVVPWYEVPQYMHLESCFATPPKELEPLVPRKDKQTGGTVEEKWIGTDEIDAILARTFDANRKKKDSMRNGFQKKRKPLYTDANVRTYRGNEKKKKEYLLVDGYNVIFAWDELKELAEQNMDGARGKLMDALSDYQGACGCELMVVFDAYRVEGHKTEQLNYHNIHVVYTKEAETADQFIEKFAHENAKNASITVATSDGLEQIIIRGEGCHLMSSRELKEEMERAGASLQESYQQKQKHAGRYLLDELTEEERQKLNQAMKEME